MSKKLYLFAFLLFPTYANSQELNDSIVTLPQNEIPSSAGSNLIQKLTKWLEVDTLYVAPNRYNYSIMLNNNSYIENYNIGTLHTAPGNKEQKLSFVSSPGNITSIHAGLGILFIQLGWKDTWRLINGRKYDSSRDKQTAISLILNRFCIDYYYWTIHNSFKVSESKGFDTSREYYDNNAKGVSTRLRALNFYYILNSRKFSFPAAYNQSTMQRKSAGSWLVGLSYANNELNLNYQSLPTWIYSQLDRSLFINKIKSYDYCATIGYAYNWVIARNLLASASLSWGAGYKRTITESPILETQNHYKGIALNSFTRAAIVYNNSSFYTGIAWKGNSYFWRQDRLSSSNTVGSVQVYMGINFGLKKEFKKKQS